MKNRGNRAFFVGLVIGLLLGMAISLLFFMSPNDKTMQININETITNETGNVSNISIDIQEEKAQEITEDLNINYERVKRDDKYKDYEPTPPELETFKLDMPNMDYEAPLKPIEYSPEPIKPIRQPTTDFDYPDKLVR